MDRKIAMLAAGLIWLVWVVGCTGEESKYRVSVGQSYREAELAVIGAGYNLYPVADAVPDNPEGFSVWMSDGRELIVYREPNGTGVKGIQVVMKGVLGDDVEVYKAVQSIEVPLSR